MGCGRVIEGTPEMMWGSLQKCRQAAARTELYCGHEYTVSNAKFALTIEPDNKALQARAAEVEKLRAAGKATLPTRSMSELATNPFLRPQIPAIRVAPWPGEGAGLAGLRRDPRAQEPQLIARRCRKCRT